MNISTLVPSLIRTYVPVAVGAFIAWLITLGVPVDDSLQTGIVTVLTGLLIAVYYTIIRLLEKKWPALSVLLGSKQMPAAYAPEGEKGVAVITTLPAPPAAPADPGPGNYPTGAV